MGQRSTRLRGFRQYVKLHQLESKTIRFSLFNALFSYGDTMSLWTAPHQRHNTLSTVRGRVISSRDPPSRASLALLISVTSQELKSGRLQASLLE